MQTTLHQDARSTNRDRLVYLLADFIHRSNVSINSTRATIERAKGTNDVTNVRVIDVSIDDVRDDGVRMETATNRVGGCANFGNVMRLEQRRALFHSHALAGDSAIENGLNIGVGAHEEN